MTVNELPCAEAQDLAPEYGLGTLAPDQRGRMAAHLLRCPECRAEVEDFGRLGDALLQLIPAAEPPLGFDQRVLVAVQPRRRVVRARLLAGVAAAAAAAVVTGLLVSGGPDHPHQIKANLLADGRSVGQVYTEGRPPWVWMTVQEAVASGPVTCELVEASGAVVRLGSFDLVRGSGEWAAPEPGGLGSIVAARLVASDGRVVAQATFKN